MNKERNLDLNIDRFIKERECLKITGLSRTTRWRLEKNGQFPKRYKISNRLTGYKYSEIMLWLESRSCGVNHV